MMAMKQSPLTPEDIHGLIQKLTELKCTILTQRKVDVALSSAITRLFTREILIKFPKDSKELLRLVHCCFDFLTECIRGKYTVSNQ